MPWFVDNEIEPAVFGICDSCNSSDDLSAEVERVNGSLGHKVPASTTAEQNSRTPRPDKAPSYGIRQTVYARRLELGDLIVSDNKLYDTVWLSRAAARKTSYGRQCPRKTTYGRPRDHQCFSRSIWAHSTPTMSPKICECPVCIYTSNSISFQPVRLLKDYRQKFSVVVSCLCQMKTQAINSLENVLVIISTPRKLNYNKPSWIFTAQVQFAQADQEEPMAFWEKTKSCPKCDEGQLTIDHLEVW